MLGMPASRPRPLPSRSAGTTLIEILVTLAIVAIGLLGTVGLQIKLQQSEFESYQRSQALLLLKDMTSRISANRNKASEYINMATAAAPLGAGMTCPVTSTSITEKDVAEWCALLQGAAELSGNSRVGALVGARGCIQAAGGSPPEFVVTVAWQGGTPAAASGNTVINSADLCGGGTTYDIAGNAACTGNRCRRAVSATVKIAPL